MTIMEVKQTGIYLRKRITNYQKKSVFMAIYNSEMFITKPIV